MPKSDGYFDVSDHRIRFYGRPLLFVNKASHEKAPVMTGHLILPEPFVDFMLEHQMTERYDYSIDKVFNQMPSYKLAIQLWELDPKQTTKYTYGSAYGGRINYYAPHFWDRRLKNMVKQRHYNYEKLWNDLKTY